MSKEKQQDLDNLDAVEYTKNILKMSCSIDEIILNANETSQIDKPQDEK